MNVPDYNSQFINYEINRQRQIEKKSVRKTLSGLGFLVFAAETVFQLSFILFAVFLSLSGLNKNSSFTEIYESVFEAYHGIALFAAFFLVGLLYCLLSNTRLSEIIRFERVKPGDLAAYVFLGLGIAYVGNILTNIFLEILGGAGITDATDMSMADSNTLAVIISTFITAVAPAFAEEFLFRGILLGKMRKYGDYFAIIASSLFFAMMHGNLQQIPFAFMAGIFFAYVTVKTNSLLPAMLIHFTNNLLSCIMQMLTTCGNSYIENFVPIVIITAVFALGALSFVYLAKKDKNLFRIEQTNDGRLRFSLKENMQLLFTNAGTIFALIILLAETVSNLSFTG